MPDTAENLLPEATLREHLVGVFGHVNEHYQRRVLRRYGLEELEVSLIDGEPIKLSRGNGQIYYQDYIFYEFKMRVRVKKNRRNHNYDVQMRLNHYAHRDDNVDVEELIFTSAFMYAVIQQIFNHTAHNARNHSDTWMYSGTAGFTRRMIERVAEAACANRGHFTLESLLAEYSIV